LLNEIRLDDSIAAEGATVTDREISAVSEHSESATIAVSFLVLIPPKMRKNRLLICLVPREHAAIPNFLPRFDRGGLP
jgi:hypothetical protein